MSILTAALLAIGVAQAPAPAASPTPPPTIIRIKSTPFCQAFRDNILNAVIGLRYNDRVIDESKSTLSKLAFDSVAEDPRVSTAGLTMDQYQLGQLVHQVAHNLVHIYALLDDPNRLPKNPRTDADRDLAQMQASLQFIADAQARWLNVISGTYESAALNDLLSRDSGIAVVLQRGGTSSQQRNLGDPIFPSPGDSTLPVAAAQADGTLIGSAPAGRMATAISTDKHDMGALQDLVTGAVMPGVTRCRAELQPPH